MTTCLDFRSDTVTQPTPAMRQAMFEAEVGDDVFDDDPSVHALQDFAAALFGKDRALFVPSGTMANQIAIQLHARPGETILFEAKAHPLHYEAGAAALLSGVTLKGLPGNQGRLTPSQLEGTIPPINPHFSPVVAVSVEDTANAGGGSVYPLEDLDGIASFAREQKLTTHMDGARLFHSVVVSGVSASRRTQGYDTVSLCLSKGLGAPVGSLLLLPEKLWHRAHRLRKAFGGGMRQAGFLAAAGLYALKHHRERLGEDHLRARALAAHLKGLEFPCKTPETNLVYFQIERAPEAVAWLLERGLKACATGPEEVRLVTHLDVDDASIARAQELLSQLKEAWS